VDKVANPGLRRELGLVAVTLSGIGIILGAGIYALIGTAAGNAGNAVWLSFVISAGVALCTAMSYAELASMFPRSAAEYEYTARSLGPLIAFVIGWLIIFSGVVGAATVALGFASYLHALTGAPMIPAGIVLVTILSALLLIGIKESATVAGIFTLIEVGGLGAVIVAGIPFLGTVDYLEMPFGIGGVLSAAALVFFAYLGFEEMVKFSEEAREPERTIPRALIIAMIVCTALYLLVAVSAVSAVGWEALSQSPAPFSLVASTVWGPEGALVLSIVALFATANTVLLMLFAASRITYGMATAGALPRLFARVHPGRQTPRMAVLLAGIGGVIFLFAGDIGFVAGVTNFTVFVTFFAINLTVVLIRYRDPRAPRPFRSPGTIGRIPVFPVLGLASCLFLLTELEPAVIGIGAAIAIAGAIVAIVFRKNRREKDGTGDAYW
jgi:APA family basic amino acid/polyamine antiporter